MSAMKKIVKPSSTKAKAPDDASPTARQALLGLLKRPAPSNAGLKDLFSRKAPWDQQATAQPSPALTSIQDAVGMLTNREDMVDPAAYVRKLRAPRF
jgi:hypothetical protein